MNCCKFIAAVSPSDFDDEDAAADLFGPDEGFDIEVGTEPATPSRDMVGEEERIDDNHELHMDEATVAQRPAGLTSPYTPTAEEVALHWLTHIPYRSWCKWCVSGKCNNTAHHQLPDHSREVPLLVADYCFLRDHKDQDVLTCLVGRLYPSRALIAIPCDVKGEDEYAVGRLVEFLRDCGITRMVYMCDQEPAIGAVIRAAVDQLRIQSTWVGAVKENSAVGESQSNGKAEAAIKCVEDQLRVMKGALESRISARIPSQHPILKWLVEYAAVVLNKYMINPSGHTAYHNLHGKRVSERIVEFGEVVLHYVPKKRRHKLDMRWAMGIFLGTKMSSNESYIGLSNGTVVRGRALTRVRPDKRWSADLIQKILGTPAKPLSSDETVVETFENPHDNAGDEQRDAMEGEVEVKHRASHRVAIQRSDIEEFGPSPNCPKCRAFTSKRDKPYRMNNHTEACRLRFYKLMEERDGKKILREQPQPAAAEAEFPVDDADFGDQTPIAMDHQLDNNDDPNFDFINESVIDDIMAEDDSGDHEPASQYGMDIDMLLALGVEPIEASRYVYKLMRHNAEKTFYEAYGRGGLTHEARKSHLNVKGLRALDLACEKPNGTCWDFSKASDQREAIALIEADDPDWIIGSPPCTSFSPLNVGLNFPKMDKAEVKRRVDEGLVHLKFVCRLYKRQMRRGKFFLHEHPHAALSWRTKSIIKILKLEGVDTVVNHQCMFGLLTHDGHGGMLPAKKPTRWMSNSPWMLSELNVNCDGSHQHQHLMSGRAAAAAFYPPQLLRAIIRGMARTRDIKLGVHTLMDSLNSLIAAIPRTSSQHNTTAQLDSTGPDVQPTDDSTSNTDDGKERTSSIPLMAGGSLKVKYSAHNFKTTYRDEYTGEVIPTHLVRAAMEEELGYFNKHVWDAVEKRIACKTDDYKLIRMRWVICNKGDDKEYDVRARLVACEVNTYKTDEYFASTPPLEAKKLLFSEYSATARRPMNLSKEIVLSFVDIKKAYFNGVPRRNIHLAFPKELGVPDHLVAHLKRCVYGTRDAGAIWEECFADALVEMGFTRGVASPCCFHHEGRNLHVVVHGDDFTCLGPKSDIIWYEGELATRFEIKRRGWIGESDGCIQEIRILNRILRLTKDGLRYEADPRHAEMLIKALGLEDATPVVTPGVKEDNDATNYDADLIHESNAMEVMHGETSDTTPIAMVDIKMVDDRTVGFSSEPTIVHEVVPYSEIYGIHPKFLIATRGGWRRVSDNAHPYTGRTVRVMNKRRSTTHDSTRTDLIDRARSGTIHGIYCGGAAWGQLGDFDEHDLEYWYGTNWRTIDIDDDGDDDSTTQGGNGLTTPLVGAVRTASSKKKNAGRQGARSVKKIEMEGNAHDLLSPEGATTYRALSARGNFLSQDRADINFTTKELCREFAAPANSSNRRLKRLARFLVHRRRLVYKFNWLDESDSKEIAVMVDTDFAGCRVTRRSTNGGVMMRGTHCIKHWSTTQPTIALSSGEAELGGLCKGAANGIGLKSVARDLGIELSIRVRSDATAALGIARRLGIGKIRHLDTSLLWIQQKIKCNDLKVDKMLGADNPADCLTKFIDQATMNKHLATMNLEYEEGRATSAPELAPDVNNIMLLMPLSMGQTT